MRKVVTGGVLAILIAGTGGYFGAKGWAQQRVEQEVETSLAAMRVPGGNVTHGPVEIELLRRRFSLWNVAAEIAGDSKASWRVGHVVATGIGQPGAGRMSAARLEIDDLEIDGTIAVGAGLHITYKIPRLEFADYSGPTAVLHPADAASPIEAIRAVLQQFAAIKATSLTIPAATVSLAGMGFPVSAVEYGYSGIVARNIGEGRIGSTTIDRMVAAVNAVGPNGPGGFTAELNGMQTLDFDIGPILAVLSGSADDRYQRVYQQITAGSYAVTLNGPQGPVRMLMDGIGAKDVALKPSKFPLAEIISLFSSLPRAGEPVDPQRALAVLDTMAGVYDGIRVGSFEMRGMKMAAPPPQAPVSIGAIRMAGFENGRLAELSLEGLDAQTPSQEPVKIGRFALKGLGFSELMRSVARSAATPGQPPSPDQLMSLLHALEGIEIQGLIVPYQNTGRPVEIETARISWSEFVGAFPTQVRAAFHISGPITSGDAGPFNQLSAAGMTTATVDLDAGARWTEASRLARLSSSATLANVGSIDVNATLGNIPASAFTLDTVTFMAATAAVEPGPIEIVVHDLGGVDLKIAEVARQQNLSPDAARRTLIETVKQPWVALVPSNADLAGLADAVARFMEAPGGRLSVSITPKGRVLLLPLFVKAQGDPATILGQFRIQSSVTR